MARKCLLVMAASFDDARRWAKNNQIPVGNWTYVNEERKLRGFGSALVVLVDGWDHQSYQQVKPIMDALAYLEQIGRFEQVLASEVNVWTLQEFQVQATGLPRLPTKEGN